MLFKEPKKFQENCTRTPDMQIHLFPDTRLSSTSEGWQHEASIPTRRNSVHDIHIHLFTTKQDFSCVETLPDWITVWAIYRTNSGQKRSSNRSVAQQWALWMFCGRVPRWNLSAVFAERNPSDIQRQKARQIPVGAVAKPQLVTSDFHLTKWHL